MRFDVRLPSSGQDRWASSLCTLKVMIQIRTLLMFIRVIKIKRWIKNTFLYIYRHYFELINKNIPTDCLSLHLSHPTFASLWLSSYIACLLSHLCTVCTHNTVSIVLKKNPFSICNYNFYIHDILQKFTKHLNPKPKVQLKNISVLICFGVKNENQSAAFDYKTVWCRNLKMWLRL